MTSVAKTLRGLVKLDGSSDINTFSLRRTVCAEGCEGCCKVLTLVVVEIQIEGRMQNNLALSITVKARFRCRLLYLHSGLAKEAAK